ncbi:hypothetical protein Ccrd_000730, partial [Cynara cardunculus var. scolymus]
NQGRSFEVDANKKLSCHQHTQGGERERERERDQREGSEMAVMEKLKMFAVQEPIVAASCLIGGVGLFLPAVVKPMLDSFESSKQVRQPDLNNVVSETPVANPGPTERDN